MGIGGRNGWGGGLAQILLICEVVATVMVAVMVKDCYADYSRCRRIVWDKQQMRDDIL